MSDDVELLGKKVDKHRGKLREQTTVLEMTRKRVRDTEQDRQQAEREAVRLRKRSKVARQEARRLASEAKRADVRFAASTEDETQARRDLKKAEKALAKRQEKLDRAKVAHATTLAQTRVTEQVR